jgi:hypothetical protein
VCGWFYLDSHSELHRRCSMPCPAACQTTEAMLAKQQQACATANNTKNGHCLVSKTWTRSCESVRSPIGYVHGFQLLAHVLLTLQCPPFCVDSTCTCLMLVDKEFESTNAFEWVRRVWHCHC